MKHLILSLLVMGFAQNMQAQVEIEIPTDASVCTLTFVQSWNLEIFCDGRKISPETINFDRGNISKYGKILVEQGFVPGSCVEFMCLFYRIPARTTPGF